MSYIYIYIERERQREREREENREKHQSRKAVCESRFEGRICGLESWSL